MSTDLEQLTPDQLEAAVKALKKKKQEEKTKAKALRSEYDRKRDQYLATVFARMEALSHQLAEFKREAIASGLILHDEMYDAYRRKRPDKPVDSYTLTSEDGTRRIIIERSERCEYDETAEVAISQIREVLRDKFAARNLGMYEMLETLLMRNAKGDYDERLVAKLRKHEDRVNDPRFSDAIKMLDAAYRPVGSQTYIRAYTRDKNGPWREVTMNWSRM